MYEAYFGLQRRPFAPVPSLEEYFPSTSIETARQTLVRCIQRAEGPALLVGPSGTGKTLLCQAIARHFQNDFNVVMLTSGGLSTRRALFQAILYGLGRPYRGMDEGELRLALADFLTSDKSHPAGMLLLADEAHTLPLRLLDEIRMLTNLVYEGKARTRLVLAGGPALEERFASPKLASFSQRLAARSYLEGFTRSETDNYIREVVVRAGGDGERLFTPDARAAVYQATDGIPRLVNQVCDHALVLAFAAGKPVVERATVEEAWADLQQLPAPWNAEIRGSRPAGGVIEFGGLKDEGPADFAAADFPSSPMKEGSASLGSTDDHRPAPPEPTSPGPAQDVPAEEQLDRIQALVGQLEDDFHPAGAIKPEVELVFDEPTSPLNEEFQEEEVISHPASNPPAAVHRTPTEPLAGLRNMRGSARRGDGELSESNPLDPQATVPLSRHLDGAQTSDEPPEIVVEDLGEDFEWVSRRRVQPVRHHEYRQLFTRLRYG